LKDQGRTKVEKISRLRQILQQAGFKGRRKVVGFLGLLQVNQNIFPSQVGEGFFFSCFS